MVNIIIENALITGSLLLLLCTFRSFQLFVLVKELKKFSLLYDLFKQTSQKLSKHLASNTTRYDTIHFIIHVGKFVLDSTHFSAFQLLQSFVTWQPPDKILK